MFTETQNGGVRRLDAEFRQTGTSVSPRPPTILHIDEVTKREGAAPRFRFTSP